ncbi:MAG: adenylate/guanylate cyclase domain-containing protein [Planctomycetes bacterium]|nr:adenylate/guanylate cyclase domain-containing protein [Planctomycetota bacterium]
MSSAGELYRFFSRTFVEESFCEDDFISSELTLEQYLANILKVTSTYLPAVIVEKEIGARNPDEHWAFWQRGALLFVDVSGFTAMSEKLAGLGRVGNEIITRILNNFFTEMIFVVRGLGGSVLKFGGDAMTVLVPGNVGETEALERALLIAQLIQERMIQFKGIKTPAGTFTLAVSIGINAGKFFLARVGLKTMRYEPVISGFAVNRTAQAEGIAQSGQIVITPEMAEMLAGDQKTQQLEGEGFHLLGPLPSRLRNSYQDRISPLNILSEKPAENVVALLSLKPYLIDGLFKKVSINPQSMNIPGEHREVSSMFVHFEGISELLDAHADQPQWVQNIYNEYFCSMLGLIHDHGGVVNRIDISDHGDKLLVLFGAPKGIGNSPLSALLCGLALQKEAVRFELLDGKPGLRQRIGINHGPVFCANVGSPIRKEYTVMGDPVNTAARIMATAEWSELRISSSVYKAVQEAVVVENLEPIRVKGKSEALKIFLVCGLRENFALAKRESAPANPLYAAVEGLGETSRRTLAVLSVLGTDVLEEDALEYLAHRQLGAKGYENLLSLKLLQKLRLEKKKVYRFGDAEIMEAVYETLSEEDKEREHRSWVEFAEAKRQERIEAYIPGLGHHCERGRLPAKRIGYRLREARILSEQGDELASAAMLEETILLLELLPPTATGLDEEGLCALFSEIEDCYVRLGQVQRLPSVYGKAARILLLHGYRIRAEDYVLKHAATLLFLDSHDEAEALLEREKGLFESSDTTRAEVHFLRARISLARDHESEARGHLLACRTTAGLNPEQRALVKNLLADPAAITAGEDPGPSPGNEQEKGFAGLLHLLVRSQRDYNAGNSVRAIADMEALLSEEAAQDEDLRQLIKRALIRWYWETDIRADGLVGHLRASSIQYEKAGEVLRATNDQERLICVLLHRGEAASALLEIPRLAKLGRGISGGLQKFKASLYKVLATLREGDLMACQREIPRALAGGEGYLDQRHVAILRLLGIHCACEIGGRLPRESSLLDLAEQMEEQGDTVMLASATQLLLKGALARKNWAKARTFCRKLIDINRKENISASLKRIDALISSHMGPDEW